MNQKFIYISDFGNYTCHAENSLGVKKESVEVSGRPHPANVTSKVVSKYNDKYILEWMVDSLFVIEECRILYRMARVSVYKSGSQAYRPISSGGHI